MYALISWAVWENPTLARKNFRLSDVGAVAGVWRGFVVVMGADIVSLGCGVES
jgi:hypothetical protein